MATGDIQQAQTLAPSSVPWAAAAVRAGSSGVYYYGRQRQRLELRPLALHSESASGARASRSGDSFAVQGAGDSERVSRLVTDAARAHFEMADVTDAVLLGRSAAPRRTALPSAFEDVDGGRVRLLYKELVVRFRSKATARAQKLLLDKYGLSVRSRNAYVGRQFVLTQPDVRYLGAELVGLSTQLADLDEVEFIVPNFASEFTREATRRPRAEQWHLMAPKRCGVDATRAWRTTAGRPAVVVAVLDDGVDIGHPDLKRRLKRQPDPSDVRDLYGRDFFLPASHPDHYDPSPKRFRYPYDQMRGNDIHGTQCAGVALADGRNGQRAYGAAPGARLLPVTIFHGDDLAVDSRVADAIRYAAR
jgi:subtilisin family serine protease